MYIGVLECGSKVNPCARFSEGYPQGPNYHDWFSALPLAFCLQLEHPDKYLKPQMKTSDANMLWIMKKAFEAKTVVRPNDISLVNKKFIQHVVGTMAIIILYDNWNVVSKPAKVGNPREADRMYLHNCQCIVDGIRKNLARNAFFKGYVKTVDDIFPRDDDIMKGMSTLDQIHQVSSSGDPLDFGSMNADPPQ